jgi:uncharacterized protein (TIGR00369 family)
MEWPERIDVSTPATLAHVLRTWAETRPEAHAYAFVDEHGEERATLTFAELDARASLVAARLLRHASGGERALLVFEPGLEFLVALFACFYAGVIAVPVEFTIPVTADITQHHGFVHGSVLGFMADSACAWAATSVAGYVLTSEYKINLLAPAVGTRLIGRGYVVRAGGRQVICRADVFVEKGGEERMVATALATIVKISLEKPK